MKICTGERIGYFVIFSCNVKNSKVNVGRGAQHDGRLEELAESGETF